MNHPDPLQTLTPEQKALFMQAQNELEAKLSPVVARYALVFDPQALVYSFMVAVARAAQEITPPIDAQGWAFASATCFEVARGLIEQSKRDDAAKRAILVPK